MKQVKQLETDDSAKKQEETEEIPEKQMEQDVRNRIMKLRAEGKTYIRRRG